MRLKRTRRIGVKKINPQLRSGLVRRKGNMETVMTRQGIQMVDTAKCAEAISKMDELLGESYSSVEECEKAEQDFRNYLLKKGYTRF